MRLFVLTALLLASSQAMAIEFRSGNTQATLLELYTSEGCSSCPPADRWFSTLKDHPRLWKDLIPVAFHVDYWNYLGWEDRFANASHSRRQRAFKTEQLAKSVHTPGFMATGEEWRDWHYGRRTPPSSNEPVGVLSAKVEGSRIEVAFTPSSSQPAELELHLAVLGFGLTTPVKAGENRGELLEHDFVVLGHRSTPGSGQWQQKLPDAPLADQATQLGLAVWVSPRGSVRVLQTVGGWLTADR